MLVLSRKVSEAIHIADDITITVLQVRGNRVRLGIVAPPEISRRRAEVNASESQQRATAGQSSLPT